MQDLHALPVHERDDDGVVHVVVEAPRGSTLKLRYEPGLGAFTVSRPLVLGVSYPFDWGFVPSTRAPDGDPLDAMVLMEGASFPGVVLSCRAIGVVRVTQKAKNKRKQKRGGREHNDRLIAVPARSAEYGALEDARELPRRVRQEIDQFFATAVLFEEKGLELDGWGGPKAAMALVDEAARAFAEARRAGA